MIKQMFQNKNIIQKMQESSVDDTTRIKSQLIVKNLVKSFKEGSVETHVLKGINFTVEKGEFVSIMGRSGAGKSTFLYQMSLLDDPTSGEIFLNGKDTHLMNDHEKVHFRLSELGYVFQDYSLLPDLTALENVELPLLMQGFSKDVSQAKAEASLKRFEIYDLNYLPNQLSGGEQQRISISRAIANKPGILFADEPTANLDLESSARVMDMFKELHDEGQTIIMVTHEEEYARFSERVVDIVDGKIASDKPLSQKEFYTGSSK